MQQQMLNIKMNLLNEFIKYNYNNSYISWLEISLLEISWVEINWLEISLLVHLFMNQISLVKFSYNS